MSCLVLSALEVGKGGDQVAESIVFLSLDAVSSLPPINTMLQPKVDVQSG